jgi:hypothetical protein
MNRTKGQDCTSLGGAGAVPRRAQTAKRRTVEKAEEWPLVSWLVRAAQMRGEEMPVLAGRLGVTGGYLTQLRAGARSTEDISRSFAKACAQYLGVSTALVYVAAGKIQMADFMSAGKTRADLVKAGLERLAADPTVGPMLPPALSDAAPAVQEFVIWLYSEATVQDVLCARALPDALIAMMQATIVLEEQLGGPGMANLGGQMAS